MNVQGRTERRLIAGEVFLHALAEHGVDFFFANPGTDFPPIVEAFGRSATRNAKLPRPVLVPHENLAVAMAHGAYNMTGRPQAVMVHVNVGTGNTRYTGPRGVVIATSCARATTSATCPGMRSS